MANESPPSTGSTIPWALIGIGGIALYLLTSKMSKKSAPGPETLNEIQDQLMDLSEEDLEYRPGPGGLWKQAEVLGPSNATIKRFKAQRVPRVVRLTRMVGDVMDKPGARPKKILEAIEYGKEVGMAQRRVSILDAEKMGFTPDEAKIAHAASMVGRRRHEQEG